MKNHRSFVPALAVALVAFGVMAAPAPANAQLKGHVKSVDTAANTVIVTETGTGTDYPIAVTGQSMVVSTAGKPLTLKDLRKGDGVSVSLFGNVASKIVVAPTRITGVVRSVDADAKRLVLRETGAEGEAGAGKDITMRVDDQATIVTTDGKTVQLGDLRQGDGVSITREGDLAQRIEVNPKPDELTGFVKSVSADLRTFVVTETGTTKDITVAVNDQTTIVTTEGRTLHMRDLKEGDGVGISHIASLAKKIVVNVKAPR